MRSNSSESEPQSNPKDSSSSEDGPLSASLVLEHTLYDELRRLAASRMRREKPGQTLQATALVHEAYLRLVDEEQARNWDSRGHFFAAAAEAMRRILMNHARDKNRLKRGGGRRRVNLDQIDLALNTPAEDLLAVDEAIQQLAEEDSVGAELVKLRFFAGLNLRQAAESLGVARRTADRHWAFARAWLCDRLEGG